MFFIFEDRFLSREDTRSAYISAGIFKELLFFSSLKSSNSPCQGSPPYHPSSFFSSETLCDLFFFFFLHRCLDHYHVRIFPWGSWRLGVILSASILGDFISSLSSPRYLCHSCSHVSSHSAQCFTDNTMHSLRYPWPGSCQNMLNLSWAHLFWSHLT